MLMSEGEEEKEAEQMAEEFRSADVAQDERHADLLQKYNDLDKEFAIAQARIGVKKTMGKYPKLSGDVLEFPVKGEHFIVGDKDEQIVCGCMHCGFLFIRR